LLPHPSTVQLIDTVSTTSVADSILVQQRQKTPVLPFSVLVSEPRSRRVDARSADRAGISATGVSRL